MYVLLLHCDGTNGSTSFPDTTGRHAPTLSGSVAVSTSQFKFGGASASFTTTSDRISFDTGSDFIFGTGDFTMDFWMRPTDLTTRGFNLIDFGDAGGIPAIDIWYDNTSSTLRMTDEMAGGDKIISAANPFIVNNWYHVALTRTAGVTRLFVSGNQVGNFNDTNNYATLPSGAPCLGNAIVNSGWSYTGFMDEVRILNGEAAWTSNFTPPTQPYSLAGPVYDVMGLIEGEC